MVKIPRCMSTQHPDNVHTPFFAEDTELGRLIAICLLLLVVVIGVAGFWYSKVKL